MSRRAKSIKKCKKAYLSTSRPDVQGPLNGGVSNGGGVPDLDLSFLLCPFLGLSRFFWDFPDLLGDGPGIFPICPFPLSRPIKSTYGEQSRKGPRHNQDLSRKKWKHPGLETPRFSFSQDVLKRPSCMRFWQNPHYNNRPSEHLSLRGVIALLALLLLNID